jgi:hypothetical protein
MTVKIVSALVAVFLLLAYLIPPVVKLKEVSLGVVIVIGIAMMLIDMWQSFREADS